MYEGNGGKFHWGERREGSKNYYIIHYSPHGLFSHYYVVFKFFFFLLVSNAVS
jgi:hypothetical protein